MTLRMIEIEGFWAKTNGEQTFCDPDLLELTEVLEEFLKKEKEKRY